MIQEHRYVVVGAGPAGLQIGYFLQERGADYVIVERERSAGGFFTRFPRHRRLISLNKVHTWSDDPELRLRWDWNSLLSDDPSLLFPDYSDDYFPSPDDLRRYLTDFHTTHDLRVAFGTGVNRVIGKEEGFRLETEDGREIQAECLIWAGGWGGPNIPDIPGIEHAEGYEDMVVDPEPFRGKRVLILGKGNSAFETAHALRDHASMIHLASPRPVRLAWKSRHPGDVRGSYGALLDSHHFSALHALLDCTVERIEFDGETYTADILHNHAGGERETLEYDAVLRCTGFRMGTEVFADGLRAAPGGRLPAITSDWESANLDGLYVAGTMMQARDARRGSSAFIYGFRYNLRTLSRLLAERYDGVRFPRAVVPRATLVESVLDRVNRSSALWAQAGYLVDALVITEHGIERFEDLPEDYAVERFGDLVTVGLRQSREPDPDDLEAAAFAVGRRPLPPGATESEAIHPAVRVFRNGVLTSELHLPDSVVAQWRHPDRHLAPLERFFARLLPP
ncbi:NAD(P)-binding domain-containing protein [Streptosporangium carneum]|uniref:Pyridine nucleotide-disulfide oxidoreductase n=2 Tax=Streptosporangium carneum TaxID=47481 RepID=A0A9W6I0J1_9ACTN|nr:NAD(P)-binding domain-containing protein [Streptosporangium carneum]GLK09472.1 pyridine nucleotide-disulfide oxidoreductase [Streptosporangium carneum]